MNEILIGKKKHLAPSNWSEFKKSDLISWAKILTKKIDPTHGIALAVMLLYGINKFTYFKFTPAQAVQLKGTLAFLSDGNKLTNWLFPFIRPGIFKKYFGPKDALTSSTIQEFRLCEIYYLAFKQTNDQEYANRLLATLFRPAGASRSQKDCRVQLSELMISENAPKMAKIDKASRDAIVFNYEGCRSFIFEKYPTIFAKSTKASKKEKLPDLEKVIRTVAGAKFGTFNETNDTPIYTFLNHLADEIEKLPIK